MQADRHCSTRGAAKKSPLLARMCSVGQSHVKQHPGLSQEALDDSDLFVRRFSEGVKVEDMAVSPRSVPNCLSAAPDEGPVLAPMSRLVKGLRR